MPEPSAIIVGMGEIGIAFYKLLDSSTPDLGGVDKIPAKSRGNIEPRNIGILHICVPFTNSATFQETVAEYARTFKPKEIVIHSSVPPGTTETLALSFFSLLVYSPFRGVHSRMETDMKRYTKYWASTQTPSLFLTQMKEANIPIDKWPDTPTSLELAKLLMDVTYYGWNIIFAQHVKVLADRFNVDDKKLWQFTDEIHKFLGNRPRMFSGEGIGGHCVMQDKNLLNDPFLDLVFSHDEYYRRNLNGR